MDRLSLSRFRVLSRRPWFAALLGVALLVPAPTYGQSLSWQLHARDAKPKAIATVKYIKGTLSVAAPHKHAHRGKVGESLYASYTLTTNRGALVSIAFPDGTLLYISQLTRLVLRSPHATKVGRGEVFEKLVPGTKHNVRTKTATAAAIGTQFDVKLLNRRTIFTVLEGALHVWTRGGSVTVKNNQDTVVTGEQRPAKPVHADAPAMLGWASAIPAGDGPVWENIALDANGGRVVGFSSQHPTLADGSRWEARLINDGRLERKWGTETGSSRPQWVTIAFAGTRMYMISAVVIGLGSHDYFPTFGELRDFEIRVSTTNRNDASFTTVLHGSTDLRDGLQRYVLPAPIPARYLQLVVVDNYGAVGATSVAELEVVGNPNPLLEQAAPAPAVKQEETATPTETSTPTPTPRVRGGYVAPRPQAQKATATPTPTPMVRINAPPPPVVQPSQAPPPPPTCTDERGNDPSGWTHSKNFGSGGRTHVDPCHSPRSSQAGGNGSKKP